MSEQSQLSPLERLLGVFTEVRRGEGATALLMFVNVFLILCAYYFIKPLREGWIAVSDIQALSKMEVKAYSSFAQGLLLIAVVRSYSRLADRVQRSVLISRATLFCMSNLVIFWILQPDFFIRNLPATGVAFYLWVGMFGVFVVAQFWAFAADLYEKEQGERLIPLIAIGATAGAAMGSAITDLLVGSGIVDIEYLLLAALVPLAFSIALTRVVDRRGPGGEGTVESAPPAPPVEEAAGESAFSLIFGNRLLMAVAVVTMLLNWVNTNAGESALSRCAGVSRNARCRPGHQRARRPARVHSRWNDLVLRRFLLLGEYRGALAPGFRGIAHPALRWFCGNHLLAARAGTGVVLGHGAHSRAGGSEDHEDCRELV